jgi:nuclear cap-binding protein subunit 1
MKASCIERFAKWFSFHLSNFQFRWSWDDWKVCLEENIESPKCKFIKETLLNCMRLSYHQRILEMIPEEMQKLAPEPPKPYFKYESEDAVNLEGTLIANKLLELMRNRCLPEDVLQCLREVTNKKAVVKIEDENSMEHDDKADVLVEDDESNALKIDVFTSTLLHFGSKSLSHIFAALAK